MIKDFIMKVSLRRGGVIPISRRVIRAEKAVARAEQKAYRAKMRYQRLLEQDRVSSLKKIEECERKTIRKELIEIERKDGTRTIDGTCHPICSKSRS